MLDLTFLYPEMNGLFGEIGNKKLIFHNNVQVNDDINAMTSISIDGNLANAKKSKKKSFRMLFDWHKRFDKINNNQRISSKKSLNLKILEKTKIDLLSNYICL